MEGPNSDDWTFDAIGERDPRRVLEVGCGWGELSERVQRETEADVTAFDLSERMAGLARARGVRAFVADVQALPFPDRSFDVVVANAVLYHVPDLDQGLAEVARVLTDDGALVAITFDGGRFPAKRPIRRRFPWTLAVRTSKTRTPSNSASTAILISTLLARTSALKQ